MTERFLLSLSPSLTVSLCSESSTLGIFPPKEHKHLAMLTGTSKPQRVAGCAYQPWHLWIIIQVISHLFTQAVDLPSLRFPRHPTGSSSWVDPVLQFLPLSEQGMSVPSPFGDIGFEIHLQWREYCGAFTAQGAMLSHRTDTAILLAALHSE